MSVICSYSYLILPSAPPFHPAGQAPRTVCPVCATRQNNHALKQIYAISGFNKGEYDDNIPHHFFQCPPVAIDAKDSAMDALRVRFLLQTGIKVRLTLLQFQFLGLVSYGIAAATKYRSLQTAHSHLKGQVDELRMQRTEAETNVHTMTERIAFLEGEDRKHKSRQPEITHYLRQFPRLKRCVSWVAHP
jgi:cell division protein FtsB